MCTRPRPGQCSVDGIRWPDLCPRLREQATISPDRPEPRRTRTKAWLAIARADTLEESVPDTDRSTQATVELLAIRCRGCLAECVSARGQGEPFPTFDESPAGATLIRRNVATAFGPSTVPSGHAHLILTALGEALARLRLPADCDGGNRVGRSCRRPRNVLAQSSPNTAWQGYSDSA